jgi:hypothetical protein
MNNTITPGQQSILESMGRYLIVTVPMIDSLNIFKNKVSIYRALKPLKEGKKPLVLSHHFGVTSKGQLPEFLFLSKAGKELLVELGANPLKIKIPTTKTFFTNDYHHRVSNLETFLYMDLALKEKGGKILFLDYYFDKAKRQAKNKIALEDGRFFIPDIITKFTYQNKTFLYLIEIHNGHSVQKVYSQVLNHIMAINLGTPREKYSFERNSRTVILFENERCMKSLMDRMNNELSLKKYLKLFIFKTINQAKIDFWENWYMFDGCTSDFV